MNATSRDCETGSRRRSGGHSIINHSAKHHSHGTSPGQPGHRVQEERGQKVDEDGRELEEEQGGQELQMGIPDGRLQWVLVQIAVHFGLHGAPPEGIVHTGGAVEDLQFSGAEKTGGKNFKNQSQLSGN